MLYFAKNDFLSIIIILIIFNIIKDMKDGSNRSNIDEDAQIHRN